MALQALSHIGTGEYPPPHPPPLTCAALTPGSSFSISTAALVSDDATARMSRPSTWMGGGREDEVAPVVSQGGTRT